MGLFRPYAQNNESQSEKPKKGTTVEEHEGTKGKSAPTPTRREAEARRREELRPTLNKKERRQRERDVAQQRRLKAIAAAEAAPERVLLRNYIDSRWTLSEFVMPVMLILLAMMLAARWWPILITISYFGVWAVVAILVVEIAVRWRGFKRELRDRHPRSSTRGLFMYFVSRMISMRRFRDPGTALDRGDDY